MLSYEQPSGHFGTMTASPLPTSTMAPHATSNGIHSGPLATQPLPPRHIWIIGGPAGTGKSTVAKYLAGQLDIPYIEGDDVRKFSWARKVELHLQAPKLVELPG